MAADNFIQVNPSTYWGAQVIALRDHIAQAAELAGQINSALSQAAADDPSDTNGLIATLLGTAGTNKTPDAVAVRNLVGSVNTNLQSGGNAFIQFRDRVNRNF